MALKNVTFEHPLVLQGPTYTEQGLAQGVSIWAQDGTLWHMGIQTSNRPTVLWRHSGAGWERVTVIGTVPTSTRGEKWTIAQHRDGSHLLLHEGIVAGDAVTGQFIDSDGALNGSSFTLANKSAAQYSTQNYHIGIAAIDPDWWVVAYPLDNGFSQLSQVAHKYYNGSSWSSHYLFNRPSGALDWRDRGLRIAWASSEVHYASLQVLDGGTDLTHLYYGHAPLGATAIAWQDIDGPDGTGWEMTANYCDMVADDLGVHICAENNQSTTFQTYIYTMQNGTIASKTAIGGASTYSHSPRMWRGKHNQLLVLLRDEDDNGDHHLYIITREPDGTWNDPVMLSFIVPGYAPTANPQSFYPGEPDYFGKLPRVCCFWYNNPGPLSDDGARYWNCGDLELNLEIPNAIYVHDRNVGGPWTRWKGDE